MAEEVGGQLQKVLAENIDIRRRLDKLEDADERHEEDIRELYKAQEGTKVYVTQILSSIQQLETKLFGLVTQLTQNQDKERKEAAKIAQAERNAERKERSRTAQGWLDFGKYVIAATLGAVILYLFTGGVK
jgi:chromosome segregation ATPase